MGMGEALEEVMHKTCDTTIENLKGSSKRA